MENQRFIFQKSLVIRYEKNSLDSIIGKINQEFIDVKIHAESNTNAQSLYNVVFKSYSYYEIEQAEAMFRSLLPINAVFYGFNPIERCNYEFLLNYSLNRFHVKKALKIVNECFDKYNETEVCISFNGGKDCTALLHLVYSVFSQRFGNGSKLKALFIKMPQSFSSLESFVQDTVNRYNLELLIYDSPDIKTALKKLKEQTSIKAILMGTRSSDLPSHKMMDYFQQTDLNWPQFIRVNPILDWTYKQVWQFIRDLNLPYCSLYDHG